MTREQFLENKIAMLHQAIVDQQCDLILPEEEWKELSEISGIPHPYIHTPEPYEPTEEDWKFIDEHYPKIIEGMENPEVDECMEIVLNAVKQVTEEFLIPHMLANLPEDCPYRKGPQ